MEVLRIGLDGLVAPLESRRQEPSKSQHYPPDAGCHAEEVEHHEEYGAKFVFRSLKEKDIHDKTSHSSTSVAKEKLWALHLYSSKALSESQQSFALGLSWKGEFKFVRMQKLLYVGNIQRWFLIANESFTN